MKHELRFCGGLMAIISTVTACATTSNQNSPQNARAGGIARSTSAMSARTETKSCPIHTQVRNGNYGGMQWSPGLYETDDEPFLRKKISGFEGALIRIDNYRETDQGYASRIYCSYKVGWRALAIEHNVTLSFDLSVIRGHNPRINENALDDRHWTLKIIDETDELLVTEYTCKENSEDLCEWQETYLK